MLVSVQMNSIKWIWNFVDFWDDVICYRFELSSHVHANALSYYHFVLPRFGLFFYYPARCTSFFGDLKWFVCNYFRQHDQIFLKFRTDDDQFVNKQEEIKTRRKGEIEKDINHICMFQIYLIRLWNDKISLLNFAKNKIQFGKWMHSLFL